jgi:hypothetical protein
MAVSEQFVTRIFGRHTTLLEGRLPDPLEDLSLPEGTQVVGSLIQGHGAQMTVLLDSPLPPNRCSTAMRRVLEAHGWQEEHPPAHKQLFVDPRHPPVLPSWQRQPHVLFMKRGASLRLEVQDERTPEGRTAVRVMVQPHVPPFVRDAQAGVLHELLPELMIPEESRLEGNGGGFGRFNASSTATVVTELSAGELLDHFLAQLEQVGWEQRDRLESPHLAVVLCVLMHEQRHYDLRLLVTQHPEAYKHEVDLIAALRGGANGSFITFRSAE